MHKLDFCTRFVYLNRRPIRFDGRPCLPAIYSVERNLVLRCSRQTEKSTFLTNTIVHTACSRPGSQILFVCPREQQALVFSNTRLRPAIMHSPLVRRHLLGRRTRLAVKDMHFKNGSSVFIRAAYHSADACRGLSASLLLVDEYQDAAGGDLAVLQETLSHCPDGRTILTGTPKSIENHLEAAFRQSTANEWTLDCACGRAVTLDEHSIGPTGIICRHCQARLDPAAGRWVPRHPEATWGDGYCICHPMVSWLAHEEILERQRCYTIGKFKNEVLGLPTREGDEVVTREELEACCSARPLARSCADASPPTRAQLVLGIDWGGGGTSHTVLVIGAMRSDFHFEVLRLERIHARDEPGHVLGVIAERCQQFSPRLIAVDGGGNGFVYNRLLLDRLPGQRGLYAIHYGQMDCEPNQDGRLMRWTVDRSATIGTVMSRVKKRSLSFPRLADCAGFLDDFACEMAVYDNHTRSVRYTHPDTQPDDALHATNYALLAATRLHHHVRGS